MTCYTHLVVLYEIRKSKLVSLSYRRSHSCIKQRCVNGTPRYDVGILHFVVQSIYPYVFVIIGQFIIL